MSSPVEIDARERQRGYERAYRERRKASLAKSGTPKRRWSKRPQDPEALREYNRRYQSEWMREYRRRNPESNLSFQRVQRIKRFGLPEGWYESQLAKQNGVCAICGEPETYVDPRTGKKFALTIDHDHSTNLVRGLLCMGCNHSIHKADANLEWLTSAFSYLTKYKKEI